MQRKKAPSPDSIMAMAAQEFPVLRASELARRREHRAANQPEQTPSRRRAGEHYDGTELRPNPGLHPGRLRAYQLPSRVGGKLYYPDGRVEPVP